jgi:hypothetical protein
VTVWLQFVTGLFAVAASARLTRLIVQDEYPPMVWIRIQWDRLTRDGGWSKLAHCGWCASPYAAALVLGTGYLCDWPTWWYLITGWLAASYAAGWIVFHDEDE